jgi:hypothetical protein
MTVQRKVQFTKTRHGQKKMRTAAAASPPLAPTDRVPHLSRLMALAIKFDGMLQRREVRDYAELARLGHVTRARITQIMNLLSLAPDIQEALLFLPSVQKGRSELKEWQVRPIASRSCWSHQRRNWKHQRATGPNTPTFSTRVPPFSSR